MKLRLLACLVMGHLLVSAATFGTAVPITGGATDLVLDEARSLLYIVNSTQNRIEVYSISQRRMLDPIPTDQQPLSAAISRSGKVLYVTAYASSVVDVIDLDALSMTSRIALPAAPEGVAVGIDERVLITTLGSSSTNTNTRLLLYDPNASASSSILNISATLPAPGTPQTPSAGQVYNATRSHLISTPDGQFIFGVNVATNSAQTVFVYEVASASVLRSRSVSNISSVLSVAPDGSKFMSGLSLFDTATLAIVAQQNAANSVYPFQQNVNFNLQQNQGGSVFAPDGSVLYSAFNIAPVQNPAARANSSQLMLGDPDNLLIQLGLQLPENLTGKMVITSDGTNIYALSQSGFLVLPVSTIYDNPIASVDNFAVVLTNDQCGVTASTRTAEVRVTNLGKGRMSASAQVEQNGVTFTSALGGNTGPGGGGPGQLIPIPLPGGGQQTIPPSTPSGTTATLTTTQQNAVTQNAPRVDMQQTGNGAIFKFTFNSSASTSLGTGTPADFLVQSPEAINIPARIRVYQNNRNSEANGTVIARPISVSTAEGLADIVADPARQRLYIANSGLNRVEVFDTAANQFLDPIKVGQLPRSLAVSPGGNILYVANTGGESISIIDLDLAKVTGSVRFPPLTYNASVALTTPSVIAAGLSGLQMVMSNGALWEAVNNQAMPRPTSPVIGSTTLQSPRTMLATPGGEYILLLAGSGVAYLYDAMSDQYVLSQQVVSTPIQGYFGPIAAGPGGQYFVVNGQALNQSLTPIGSTAATSRTISAVAAVNATTFARFVQPTRSSTTAAVTSAPTVEVVDVTTGTARGLAASALEGPLSTQVGTQRVNVSARTMAVDSTGSTAYLLTTSGLSIVPLSTGGSQQSRPQVNQNGVVNNVNNSTSIAPNTIVSILGQNLASDATYAATPLPTILGGTCITLDNQPVPLLMTSSGQINAQIPPDLSTGKHTLVVRSMERNAASAQQSVTVSKYAPAVFINSQTGQAAVYHKDGTPVSKSHYATRDEPLVMYAGGLGATKGGKVTAGNPSPSDPLAVTDPVQLFFGDPSYRQAEVIVDWSGLVPGLIGVYELDLRIPGDRMKGDTLSVTLRIGGVNSPTTGTAAPAIAVH